MRKQKQKPKQKPAEQIAKEAAEKRAEKLRLCWISAAKLGKAVRFSFLRENKKAIDCETDEAETIFDAAVKEGKIKEAGMSILGDVIFYECKNLD